MTFTDPFGEGLGSSADSQIPLNDGADQNPEHVTSPLLMSFRSARNSVISVIGDYVDEEQEQIWRDKASRIFAYARPVLFTILPGFILSPIQYYTCKSSRTTPKRLSPTAYLDGLRGVAAFTVYIFHITYLWYPSLRMGYMVTPAYNWFSQMSMIRILHSGRSSVAVFFVISGYVLTIRSLTMIYQRKNDQFLNTLVGSSFRRPLRLYLPIVASTFIIAVMVHFGYYIKDPTRALVPPVKATLGEQLQHWFWDLVALIYPFKSIKGRENIAGMIYDGHLWTIPVEFQGSLLVFMLLLIFARARRWIHIAATMLVVYWLVHNGEWDKALFPVGLLLAELSIIVPAAKQHDELPTSITPVARNIFRRCMAAFRYVWTFSFFLLGIHMMCFPEIKGAITPGFKWMNNPTLVSPYYLDRGNDDRIQLYWNAIGAILFIIALMYFPPVNAGRIFRSLVRCDIRMPWYRTNPALNEQEKMEMDEALSSANAPRDSDNGEGSASQPAVSLNLENREPFLQRLFTTSVSQYLGQLSYSLYLWHGMVNHAVGVRWINPAQVALAQAEAVFRQPPAGISSEVALEGLHKAISIYGTSFIWGMLVNTFVLLWVSDVFNRLVDVPAVRFTRWISEKSFRND
ncbi:hypothetical protein CkaCkLH20_10115 [Colletotrichum karsti]|uniref:Acyltransferase 3 domain-containing protein n=1 Tax=Colletotrichum karsti TaxID=1095194 RepID=A0A9P6HVQ1_9PEZI|nr:uncharacterized protein CkaCkLH20_10115 [Colletotrichum karsti]KAF9872288.1 hypothetical protein CkaCkLH20_10115 [Colletotrichum karsti]